MEILVGVVLSIVLEVYKKLAEKWGVKTTRTVIYSVLFVGSLVYTLLFHFGVITKEMIESFVSVGASAIATFEVIIKPLRKILEGQE